ncbi:MAG: efflux RND transporter periplasmic adaptor subunit [Solitalea-like symbiont of Acarus siro]
MSTAQTNMVYSIIKAPIDGYIALIKKRIGSLIKNTDAEPITVLTSTNTIYAYFSMSELDFHNLYSKLPGRNMDIKTKNIPNVHLKLPDGQIYESNGRISVVTKQIDSTTGSITLRADFPNYNNILLSGGTAKIILNRNITDVIAIPIKAVLDIQDKAFVYVLDKDNKAQQRQIIIGYRNNNFYIIEAGLNPGERIVIDGLNKVSNGTKVINTKS